MDFRLRIKAGNTAHGRSSICFQEQWLRWHQVGPLMHEAWREMGGLCSSCVTRPKAFRGQRYRRIRRHYIRLSHNIYFKDLKFPASDSILTVSSDVPRNVEWKRPSELCDEPNLLVGLLGQNSVKAGLLSQPWIVCAFSLLAARTELWHWVVPQYRIQCWGEQPSDHPGIFHFRLWWRGDWVDIVVDDQLPVLDGTLIGAQSSCSSEWWPALLEKAYAKLLGSYAALKSVELSDVLVDLTGGIAEQWVLPVPGESEDSFCQFFKRLKIELMHQSLLIAWVKSQNLELEEGSSDRTTLGLKLGQPYLILTTKKISLESSTFKELLKNKDKVAVVKICNPFQTTGELNSVESTANCKMETEENNSEDTAFVFTHKHLSRMLSKVPEWSRISESDRHKMGLTVDNDREFWMPLEDFLGQFSHLCACRLLNSSGAPSLACGGAGDSLQWTESNIKGIWTVSKGGRISPYESLLQNPQFLVDVPKKGSDVVFQLLQWSGTTVKEDLDYPSIGITVLKVEENRKYRLHTQLGHCPSVLSVGEVRKREVNGHIHLSHGRYLVVPHTEWQQSPQQLSTHSSHFLLRYFSSSPSKLRSVTLDAPPQHWWSSCFSHHIECITVVTVKAAEGLKHQSSIFGSNPFCEIICEGVKVRTPVIHNSVDPNWDRSFIFYRKSSNVPLTARVLRYRTLLPNVLIGQTQLPAPVNHQPSLLRVDLQLPGHDDSVSQGTLILEITTEDDINAI